MCWTTKCESLSYSSATLWLFHQIGVYLWLRFQFYQMQSLVSFLLVGSHYSSLSFAEDYGHLIDVVALPEFVVLAITSCIQAAGQAYLETFERYLRIEPRTHSFHAISLTDNSLVDSIAISISLYEQFYKTTTAFRSLEVMRYVH